MPYTRPYIVPGMPATAPPSGNSTNQSFPTLNETQFIPSEQPAHQPSFPYTHVLYRAITHPQQTPLPTFANTNVNTPSHLQAEPASFNQNAPQIHHPPGFHNPQGRPQQPPHSYQDYTIYHSDKTNTRGQSPVIQVQTNINPPSYQDYTIYHWDKANSSNRSPVIQVRTNTNLPPSLSQGTIYSTTQNWTPAYTSIPTSAYPITKIASHQTDVYEAANPEYGAVNTKRKKTKKINSRKSTLNPNTAEFVPGKTWPQPNSKKLETKDITKGSSKVVKTLIPLKEIHESHNPGPDSKKVDKTPDNSTSSPIQTDKFDRKVNTLLPATKNDESSVVVADGTRQTDTISPIPPETDTTKETEEHETDREVKRTEIPTVAKEPILSGNPVDVTAGYKFISDGSCRPKDPARNKGSVTFKGDGSPKASKTVAEPSEKTDRSETSPVKDNIAKEKPVALHSILVQEVLNLELKNKKPQQYPKVLDLLYLNTFDFKKKHDLFFCINIDTNTDRDISAPTRKALKQKKKHFLEDFKNELKTHNYQGTSPRMKDMERMLSPKQLLSPPKSPIDIHTAAYRLLTIAHMINVPMYQRRQALINSLSTHYVNDAVFALDCVKNLETKKKIEDIGTNNIANLENILMLFFPYFDQQQLTVKADFLNPVFTLFCYPELATNQLKKKLYENLEADAVNAISSYDLHYQTTLSGIISLADSLNTKIKKADNEPELLTYIRKDSPANDDQVSELSEEATLSTSITDDHKLMAIGNQPKLPEEFSRESINTHIILVCDLVHKMIKMIDTNRLTGNEIDMVGPLDSLLNIINDIGQQLPEFLDEYIMVAQSYCFFLQNKTIHHLLSLQKKQQLSIEEFNQPAKKAITKLPAKVELTLLKILENSLEFRGLSDNPKRLKNNQGGSPTANNLAHESPEETTQSTAVNDEQFLNISMCLLKTISDNSMFLPANQKDEQERLARLATFCETMLKKLGETLAQEGQKSNTYPEKVLRVCMPVFKGVSYIIKEGIPNSVPPKQLETAISKLTDQCETRLDEIMQKQREYQAELDREYFGKILKAIKERATKACQERENKAKKEEKLKNKAIIENDHPQENISPEQAKKLEVIEQHNTLITKTEELLETFKKDLRKSIDYKAELEKLDDVFKIFADQPDLQVWIYGEIAYDLFQARSIDFDRAKLFAQAINSMDIFCTKILEELLHAKGKRDHHWLYTRDKNQPISQRSLLNLITVSDPEKIQTLVVRALNSVQFYQKALDKAKTVVHNPLEEVTLLSGNKTIKYLAIPKRMQALSDRIDLINNEIKELQHYLRELQNIPLLSDVLKKRRQVFKLLLRPFKENTTLHSTNASRSNKKHKNTDDDEFAKIVKKAKKEWVPNTSITQSQEDASEQLELIMKGFTDLQQQLKKEHRNASKPINAPPVTCSH